MINIDKINDFLAETKYCDKDNPLIKYITNELVLPCRGNNICSSIQIFNWVRDEIKYSFDYWNVKASETLEKLSGMCANKANLQIAMLRSIGIPAGYMVLRINKKALKSIATDEIYDKSSDVIIHVYCCVLLNGEWIGADATVDRELYDAAYIDVPDWDFIEWDGSNHLHISENYINDVSGPFPNLDEYMDMPHRFMNDDIANRANEYIEGLRSRVRSLVG
jgi:transglutaminase-like putative cysteine protease